MVIHGAVKDITVEVVRRNPDDHGKGFVPQPKRWVVEQVNGTLMLHRRLAREPLRDRWRLYALAPAAGWGWC